MVWQGDVFLSTCNDDIQKIVLYWIHVWSKATQRDITRPALCEYYRFSGGTRHRNLVIMTSNCLVWHHSTFHWNWKCLNSVHDVTYSMASAQSENFLYLIAVKLATTRTTESIGPFNASWANEFAISFNSNLQWPGTHNNIKSFSYGGTSIINVFKAFDLDDAVILAGNLKLL